MRSVNLRLMICLGALLVPVCLGQAVPQEDPEKAAEKMIQADVNRRVDSLRSIGKTEIIRDRYKNSPTYAEAVKPLYRDLSREESILLRPEQKFFDEHAEFLRSSGTGLTKLIGDRGCDENPGIVDSKPHCLKYLMPGAGASFSFRTGGHRLKRLADISFSKREFRSEGVLTHGIFVDLGRAEFENLTLESEEISVLRGFAPPEDFALAENFARQLKKGIRGEKFSYASSVPVKAGNVYALRSIAYRGNSFQTVRDITYDEFEFDKRRDVIVVFRVLEADEESATILWRELDNKKSPRLDGGD